MIVCSGNIADKIESSGATLDQRLDDSIGRAGQHRLGTAGNIPVDGRICHGFEAEFGCIRLVKYHFAAILNLERSAVCGDGTVPVQHEMSACCNGHSTLERIRSGTKPQPLVAKSYSTVAADGTVENNSMIVRVCRSCAECHTLVETPRPVPDVMVGPVVRG